ncbi:unnamed protein product [Brassica napus]|uniref:Uncharacterized protein n=2 Tax=Brassica TaxID=3705 RepID=A0A0D3CWK2_BRAOL|nr:unnamed protein product [Brassica napus]
MRRRAMELQAWVEEGLGQRWSTMMCTVGKRSTGSGYSPKFFILLNSLFLLGSNNHRSHQDYMEKADKARLSSSSSDK